MIPFIDFHTHRRYNDAECLVIQNFTQNEWQNTEGVSLCSMGLHPWFLTKENFESNFEKLSQLIDNQIVIMFGECGLDRIKGEDLGFQIKAFEAQIHLAESKQKPIVIHCVKAYSELVSIKKKMKPKVPMIVHGFNQNKQILNELLKNGFYISIGAEILRGYSNASKLIKKIPFDRLFFETDDNDVAIKSVYTSAANILNIDEDKLKGIIYENFKNVLSR